MTESPVPDQKVTIPLPHRHGVEINRLFAVVIAIGVVALMCWTAYLALSLPARYDTRNWNAAWVGFDVILCVVLAYAAWAAWFRREIMVVTAIMLGTLLMCDAWFDVVTSFGSKGGWFPLLTAIVFEIPLSIFFFWVAYRILVRVVAIVHELSENEGAPPKVSGASTLMARRQRARRLSHLDTSNSVCGDVETTALVAEVGSAKSETGGKTAGG